MQAGPAPVRGTEAPLSLAVSREADVAPAVAAALRFCTGQGCSPLLAAHVATAASELANNLWMHASRGGRITLRAVQRGSRPGVELGAEDQGPGIADIEQAMREGYSTGGGLGCGLPGVQRLMDEFEIASVPGQGTRVTARKWLPLLR
jgi:serine/threonine-protein kinase RsbT